MNHNNIVTFTFSIMLLNSRIPKHLWLIVFSRHRISFITNVISWFFQSIFVLRLKYFSQIMVVFCGFLFVCLSGVFFLCLFFGVFFLNWRNSTYSGNGVGSFGSALDLFPFSRSAHDKCKYIPEYVSRRHASWSNWLLVSVVQKPIWISK